MLTSAIDADPQPIRRLLRVVPVHPDTSSWRSSRPSSLAPEKLRYTTFPDEAELANLAYSSVAGVGIPLTLLHPPCQTRTPSSAVSSLHRPRMHQAQGLNGWPYVTLIEEKMNGNRADEDLDVVGRVWYRRLEG